MKYIEVHKMAVVVKTVSQLKDAIRDKEKKIYIADSGLAKKVKVFKGIKGVNEKNISSGALMASLGGMEIVYIVALLVVGTVVLYALYKDYNVKGKYKDYELVLERN